MSQLRRLRGWVGRLVCLPAGAGGPDPEAFLDDVLSGWRQAHLAQNFSGDTVRRRVSSVKQMTNTPNGERLPAHEIDRT